MGDVDVLVGFVRDRLVELWFRAVAASSPSPDWQAGGTPRNAVFAGRPGRPGAPCTALFADPRHAAFTAHADPAAALAFCERAARIVNAYTRLRRFRDCSGRAAGLELAVRHLAAIWSTHRAYRCVWAPQPPPRHTQ